MTNSTNKEIQASFPTPPAPILDWAWAVDDDDDDEQRISSSMASASAAVAQRPRLVDRSGLSDSSNANTQESGSSCAFSSARESNLPTGCHLVTTVAVSTPPDVPTPVEPTRERVSSDHRRGRQALDLTIDKPLPNIPASSTNHPVRCCWHRSFIRCWHSWLIHSSRSHWHVLRLRPGSSHSEASSNLYDGDAQTS
jgi:hypothetical protein